MSLRSLGFSHLVSAGNSFRLSLVCCTQLQSLRAFSRSSIICRPGDIPVKQPPQPFPARSPTSKGPTEPLRILFCGSDEVSASCLEGLDDERKQGKSNIKSIDVVCRPQKRSGRGGKTVRERPIAETAQALELPLHEIDTFTGWNPPRFKDEGPSNINLIIAVSFGLFVPRRLINGAIYGGLNVHPSILPDLRGAAPIHWTLLYGDKFTGVTLQTLHLEKIDHGTVLKQTPYPGLAVPEASATVVDEDAGGEDPQYRALRRTLQEESKKILVDGLRERVYIPPLRDVSWFHSANGSEANLRAAPKIMDEHSHIDWKTWSAHHILLRQRILGSAWSSVSVPGGTVKLKFTKPFILLNEDSNGMKLRPNPNFPPGCPYVAATLPMPRFMAKRGQVMVNTCDGQTFHIDKMIVSGQGNQDPLPTLVKSRLLSATDVKGGWDRGEWTYWKLREPLK